MTLLKWFAPRRALKKRRAASAAPFAARAAAILAFSLTPPALADSASRRAPAPAAPAAESRYNEEAVKTFLKEIGDQASKKGVSRDLVNRVFKDFRPDPKVIAADERQAEFVLPLGRYIATRVSERQIARGREEMTRHARLLQETERRYGVDRHILLAIWGMETNFGTHQGDYDVAHALGTLAMGERRRAFAYEQLLALLAILQENPSLIPLRGSWAGAIGHVQFIPTSYARYAIDADGDGKRDLAHSLADAFGSAANYLASFGWRADRSWGFEAKLPKDFSYALAEERLYRPLSEWGALGVRDMKGEPLQGETPASLILPAGHLGPAFLTTKNFEALLRYNRAYAYALSVGHLADRLRGGKPFAASWEKADKELLPPEKLRLLQTYLSEQGFDTGGADGMAGRKTRAAIRAYQKKRDLPQDGYPSLSLLRAIRAEKRDKP